MNVGIVYLDFNPVLMLSVCLGNMLITTGQQQQIVSEREQRFSTKGYITKMTGKQDTNYVLLSKLIVIYFTTQSSRRPNKHDKWPKQCVMPISHL